MCVKKDYKKAISLYERSCKMGNATACYNAGYMYKEGIGIPKNLKKASEYFKRACDMGDQEACNMRF